MAHTIMGIVVLLIAFSLVGIAIVVTPTLRYLSIGHRARIAFGTLMVSLAAYLAWVSKLFFNDELGPVNYTRELVILRVITLIAAIWFTVAAIQCSRKLARLDPKVSTQIVREDGHEHPCPKYDEDDT